jgi:1-deoxy-D-xylulose-5-phosphate reductoisomerase
MENIAIIGSTGSIGKTTLKVISNNPGRYQVVALAAHSNIDLIEKQINIYKPKIVSIWDEAKAHVLRKRLAKKRIKIVYGEAGLIEVATVAIAHKVVFALSGMRGLIPLLEAIRHKKNIAIANKELLVIAGSLIKAEVARHNVTFVPIDSEHSAIFQCLQGHDKQSVRKIQLTASGGPFIDTPVSKLPLITASQALRHPKWKMGKKISIDSATMMNKGLEAIEASILYDVDLNDIEVLIHRQSIIHSLIEYCDGNVLAQLSETDMYFPISYALSYPVRLPYVFKRLRLDLIKQLTFEVVNKQKFPCFSLALSAGKKGGTMTTVLNAANEVAVNLFLRGTISFVQIPECIRKVLNKHQIIHNPTLADILQADGWARQEVQSLC